MYIFDNLIVNCFFSGGSQGGILRCSVADDNTFSDNVFLNKQLTNEAEKDFEAVKHMGREHASREKKLPMVNFLIFVQKNVSTIRFQEIKIRPFGDFEKMRFLCFYIIKSMARKGYFGPKSDFRGSKIPPRGASST